MKPFVLSSSQVRACLWLILAIATFLRVYRLDSVPPGLFTDEAMDGNNAIEATAKINPNIYRSLRS